MNQEKESRPGLSGQVEDHVERHRGLRIHMLAEGDAESWDSWSGISKSLVTHLRQRGHEVIVSDVDLYGLERFWVALGELAANRKRWWVKYHLNARPFLHRSRRAAQAVSKVGGEVDLILQIGATFKVPVSEYTPVFLYCDGNIALSEIATIGGQSEAVFLADREKSAIMRRESEIYNNSTHIFTLSDRLRRSFIADFGISQGRVSTVYAGSNLPRQPLDDVNCASGPPSILFVGRDFERKGGEVLLSAFRRVKEALPEAELRIVGPQGIADQEGVRSYGLLDKRVEAERRKLEELFRTSDVFCLPTRYEGFSISFLEAMSFGLPCVSTFSEWSPPEMIEDGETGLVVALDDPGALSSALLRLLQDRDLRRRMGAAGHRRVNSLFTWDAVVDRMESSIREYLTND